MTNVYLRKGKKISSIWLVKIRRKIILRCNVSVCLLKSEPFMTLVSDSPQTRERNVEINLQNFHYQRFYQHCNSSWTLPLETDFLRSPSSPLWNEFSLIKCVTLKGLYFFRYSCIFPSSINFGQFLILLGSKWLYVGRRESYLFCYY